jgi:hypothetical protein
MLLDLFIFRKKNFFNVKMCVFYASKHRLVRFLSNSIVKKSEKSLNFICIRTLCAQSSISFYHQNCLFSFCKPNRFAIHDPNQIDNTMSEGFQDVSLFKRLIDICIRF